jgi:sulfide dehydrogenase cytochrome subunit
MRVTRFIGAVVLLAASGNMARAASIEPPAGAASCTGCHAASAGVKTPVPRLTGRNAAEIVQQMQAFRVGQRDATVMGRIAKGFTDAEVEAIAAWYAGQR